MLTGKIIYSFILAAVFLASSASAQTAAPNQSFDLKLNYSGGNLKLSEITLVNTPSIDRKIQPNDGWQAEVISADGMMIDSFKFVIPSIVCRDQSAGKGLEGGCLEKETSDFSLNVPYHPKGALINIHNPGGDVALSVSTLAFADLCGDDICESSENRLTCPKDCRSGIKDSACDGVADGTCDPDCAAGKDPDCAADFSKSSYLMIFVILIVIALAGAAVWQGKRNRQN